MVDSLVDSVIDSAHRFTHGSQLRRSQPQPDKEIAIRAEYGMLTAKGHREEGILLAEHSKVRSRVWPFAPFLHQAAISVAGLSRPAPHRPLHVGQYAGRHGEQRSAYERS